VDVVEWWWNGSWGRLVRRDVWLLRGDVGWHVRVRAGGAEGRELTMDYDDETRARAQLRRLLSEQPEHWRRLDV